MRHKAQSVTARTNTIKMRLQRVKKFAFNQPHTNFSTSVKRSELQAAKHELPASKQAR